jgi:excisionase family DNA binding protein
MREQMPERVFTMAEITEALTLRGSLQDQVDELRRQIEAISKQLIELRLGPREYSVSTASKTFLSRKDAAAVLSISVSSLEQLIIQGEIKTRQLGGRVMIPREQIDQLARRDVKIVWPPKRQGKTVRK